MSKRLRIIYFGLLTISAPLFAGDKAIWWSVGAFTASQAMDAASSMGQPERNPLLAGPDGQFTRRSAAAKFGITGAMIATELTLIRRHPALVRWFSLANFTTSGVTTGIAIHNWRMR